MITEGTTEKVLQFMMQIRSIYNKSFVFIVQKGAFEHCRDDLMMKNHLIGIIFVMKIFCWLHFQRLMLVLNKDPLSHWPH